MRVVEGPDNRRETWLAQAIERYGKDLLRICCLYLKDASMAEDAVQETFLKAYQHLDAFRGESSEKTWLFSISVNVCRDMRRKAWYRYVDRAVDLEKLHIPVQTTQERDLMLMQEIMRLPRRSMETVLLHYYADLTLEEIAQMLQISQPAVSKRLSKARRMLRDALEGGKRL